MVVICAVCGMKYDDSLEMFHWFPQDGERCNVWVKLIYREDLKDLALDVCSENYGLCSDHFAQEIFYDDKLRDDAVPLALDREELPPPPPALPISPTPTWNDLGCWTADAVVFDVVVDSVEEAMDIDTVFIEVDNDVITVGVVAEAITDVTSETDCSVTVLCRVVSTDQDAYEHLLRVNDWLFLSALSTTSEIETAAASPALPTTSHPVPSSLPITEQHTPLSPQPWPSLSSILREELQAAIDDSDEDLINSDLEEDDMMEYESYSDDDVN